MQMQISRGFSLVIFCLCFRKMYWTDHGTESGIPAKVASADMDGSNAAILFTHNLEHVEFITIDIRENKLYWAVTGTGVVGPFTHVWFIQGKKVTLDHKISYNFFFIEI